MQDIGKGEFVIDDLLNNLTFTYSNKIIKNYIMAYMTESIPLIISGNAKGELTLNSLNSKPSFVDLYCLKIKIMAEIIIKVDERAAEKWQLISQKKRNRLAALVSSVLDLNDENILAEPEPGYGLPEQSVIKKHVKKLRKNEAEYTRILEAARKEAAAMGMTQDILDQLLAEDE